MTGALLATWAANLAATAGLAAILWIAWGLGLVALRILRLTVEQALEEAVLAAGLGLSALSAATFLLGCAGLYRPFAFVPFFVFLGTPALTYTMVRFRRLAQACRSWRFPRRDPAAWILAGAAAAAWLTALSPTIFYDALVYHFAVPNLYLLRGGITPLPNLMFSNFPLHVEMMYLLGLYLGGPLLAGLMNFGFAILAAAAAAALVRPLADPAAGRAAAALFLLAPPVLLSTRFGTVEIALALWFVLEVLCLSRWREGGSRGWAVAAGLCAGWCFSTKYVGGLFALLPPAILLVEAALRAPGRRSPDTRDATGFTAAAGTAALPWLLKNAVLTGNPVFPVLVSLFGGRGWSAAQNAAYFADSHSPWAIGFTWEALGRLPAQLVLDPGQFGAAAESAWFWPVTLAGAVVAAAVQRDRPAWRIIALLGGYLVIWSSTFWLARLLIPAMAVGTVLVALALRHLERPLPFARGAVLLILALWTTAALAQDSPTRRSFLPALGLESRDAYLSRMVASYPAVKFINERLPPAARILVLGESRVAYLRRDHVHGSTYDLSPLALLAGEPGSAAGIEAGLRGAGITHLLVNNRELARVESAYPLTAMAPPLKEAFARFLNTRCRLLMRTGDVYLAAMPERAPP